MLLKLGEILENLTYSVVGAIVAQRLTTHWRRLKARRVRARGGLPSNIIEPRALVIGRLLLSPLIAFFSVTLGYGVLAGMGILADTDDVASEALYVPSLIFFTILTWLLIERFGPLRWRR